MNFLHLTQIYDHARYDPFTVFSKGQYELSKKVYEKIDGLIKDNYLVQNENNDFNELEKALDNYKKELCSCNYGEWYISSNNEFEDEFEILYKNNLIYSVVNGHLERHQNSMFNDTEMNKMSEIICDKLDISENNSNGYNRGL